MLWGLMGLEKAVYLFPLWKINVLCSHIKHSEEPYSAILEQMDLTLIWSKILFCFALCCFYGTRKHARPN